MSTRMHPVLIKVQHDQVAKLQVRHNCNMLCDFDPETPLEELREFCESRGPGRYLVYGFSAQKRQLPGYRKIEIEEAQKNVSEPPTTAASLAANAQLTVFEKQLDLQRSEGERLALERQAVADERCKEREAEQTRLDAEQERQQELQVDLEQKRQGLQQESRSLFREFMAVEQKRGHAFEDKRQALTAELEKERLLLESKAKERDADRQAENEKRATEMRERDADRQAEHERRMSHLDKQVEKLEARQQTLADEELDYRLTRQRELMELEMDKREFSWKRENDLSPILDGKKVPSSVHEKYWERHLDKVLPQADFWDKFSTVLERVMGLLPPGFVPTTLAASPSASGNGNGRRTSTLRDEYSSADYDADTE